MKAGIFEVRGRLANSEVGGGGRLRSASFGSSTPRSQRGVILLIALIMLVAMTLAAIGMMRSVDTGSVIAGNMAFKQATLNASDLGSNVALNALMAVANSNNGNDKLILQYDSGQPCPAQSTAIGTGAVGTAGCQANKTNFPGYYSSPISPCEVTQQIGGTVNGVNCPTSATAWAQNQWWMISSNWNGAPNVTVADPNNGGTIANVQYLIHRMCQAPNSAATITPQGAQLCQSASAPPLCHTNICPPNITLFFYRITTRSVGVRGTVTYAQTMVLIGA